MMIKTDTLFDFTTHVKNNLTWDYSEWKKGPDFPSGRMVWDQQNNWNQTIVTLVNQISAQIHKSSFRGGANTILVSRNLENFFYTLEYYLPYGIAKNGGMLGGKCEVTFDDEMEDNVIFLYYKPKEEFLAMPSNLVSDYDNTQIGDVLIKTVDETYTETEIAEYVFNLKGIIRIENYNGE